MGRFIWFLTTGRTQTPTNKFGENWSQLLATQDSCNLIVTLYNNPSPSLLSPLLPFGGVPNPRWPCVLHAVIMDLSQSGCCLSLDRPVRGVFFSAGKMVLIKSPKGKFCKGWFALVPICRLTINSPAAYACSCLIGNRRASSQCSVGVSVKDKEENLWMVS